MGFSAVAEKGAACPDGVPRSSARRGPAGLTEADAFLTRLELLSADITEPLAQVYGAVTDPDRLATDLVLDATPRLYISNALYRSARDILLRGGLTRALVIAAS